jgi:SurA N-terminal domain
MGTGALRGLEYDPPDYSACVDAKKDVPAPAGGNKQSDERLTQEWQREFEEVMPGVVETLIHDEWVRQKAAARGIGMSQAEIEHQLEKDLQRAGATEEQSAESFLRDAGMTREEWLADIHLDLLEESLANDVASEVAKTSEEEIEDYARRNPGGARKNQRLVT